MEIKQNNDFKNSENETAQNFTNANIQKQENNFIFKLNVLKHYSIKSEFKKWLFSVFVKSILFALSTNILFIFFFQFAHIKTITTFTYQLKIIALIFSFLLVFISTSEFIFNRIFKK